MNNTTTFKLHGLPLSIVLDKDITFTVNYGNNSFHFKEFKWQWAQCITIKRTIKLKQWPRIIWGVLRVIDQKIGLCEFPSPSGGITSLQITPFEALYGYPPPRILDYIPSTACVDSVDQILHNKNHITKLLKHNIQQAQNRMKKYSDLKRKEQVFEKEEWVYLTLQPSH